VLCVVFCLLSVFGCLLFFLVCCAVRTSSFGYWRLVGSESGRSGKGS
jgi:hypothetical protein